jgi:enterochelin esterase family protein
MMTEPVELTFPDPRGSLRAVTLLHELRPPRRLDFTRERPRDPWRLTMARPEADRMEYLLELTRRAGSTEVVPDPANPLRAAGPFGEKSILEFPGYQAPAWVSDEDTAPGELRPLPLESVRLRTRLDALLWSAADTDPRRPLPLLVVHDGPEYAAYCSLPRLLDHLVDFGEIPELRAVLLPPPGDRNEAYSASARYANALAAELLPAIREQAPTNVAPVLMGASLGAVAALHAHFRNPGLAGGLFLQSGSFFRRRFDSHEGNFPRFARIARFVGQVHGRSGFAPAAPTKITCGRAEENYDNNVALAAALVRRGWPVRTAWNRDAHNWIAWRDALHPHLADLLLRVWT